MIKELRNSGILEFGMWNAECGILNEEENWGFKK